VLAGIGLILALSMFLAGSRYDWLGYPAILLALGTWPLGFYAARRARRVPARVLAFLLGLTAVTGLALGGPSLFIAEVGRSTVVEVVDWSSACPPRECLRSARVTAVATGEDLGWTSPKCSYDTSSVRGSVTSVWTEPTGFMQPSFVDCGDQLRWPRIAAVTWLVLAGGVIAARMAAVRRKPPRGEEPPVPDPRGGPGPVEAYRAD
jgi:hypothetical protein